MLQRLLSATFRLLSAPLRREGLFALFMFLLGSLCILITEEPVYLPRYLQQFAVLLFYCWLLAAFISMMPTGVRPFVRSVVAVLLYTVAAADVFCFVRIGTSLSPTVTQMVLDTSSDEASGFFATYVSADLLVSPFAIVMALSLLHLVVRLLAVRRAAARPFAESRPAKPFHRFLSPLFALLLAFFAVCSVSNVRYKLRTFLLPTAADIEFFFGDDFWARRAFFLPVDRLFLSLHINRLATDDVRHLTDLGQHPHVDSCRFTSPTIVLIIGESYNKHHASLYGYPLPTTPCLQALADSGRLAVFRDVVTPYNFTSDAFKNMFSLNDLSAGETWSSQPLFTQLMRQAGYTTMFITNQFARSEQKSIADFNGSVFLNDRTLSRQQFTLRNESQHAFDLSLIDEYRRLITHSQLPIAHPRLVIFHLVGQHAAYSRRYPPTFACFNDSLYAGRIADAEARRTVAHYDCSVRYNDYVVMQLLSLFAADEAIAVCLADHGEEVYDELPLFGRTHHPAIDSRIARNEFEIPFFIWWSDRYAAAHPDVVEAVRAAVARPADIDLLPHLVLGLAGVSTPLYRPHLDLLSPSYDTGRRRLLRQSVDYDSI